MSILPLIVASVVVIGLALALVLVPLFRKSGSAAEWGAAESLSAVQELEARRDQLYQSLRDLEFDRQVGKITDEDYETFSARYKSQAAEVLRQLSAATGHAPASPPPPDAAPGAALDAALEAAIRARRQTATVADGHRAAEPVGAAPAAPPQPAAPARYCTHCGHALGPADKFCANCGTPVQR